MGALKQNPITNFLTCEEYIMEPVTLLAVLTAITAIVFAISFSVITYAPNFLPQALRVMILSLAMLNALASLSLFGVI